LFAWFDAERGYKRDTVQDLWIWGWAAIICKVYEVDPMLYPRCGGAMKVVAFLTENAVVDRIIDHLKLPFAAERLRRRTPLFMSS
jgi:hypothetical protein